MIAVQFALIRSPRHIYMYVLITNVIKTYVVVKLYSICVASLQKGPHVAKIKN